jgi:hypothetical protein
MGKAAWRYVLPFHFSENIAAPAAQKLLRFAHKNFSHSCDPALL